jgi:hypothetical protein
MEMVGQYHPPVDVNRTLAARGAHRLPQCLDMPDQ